MFHAVDLENLKKRIALEKAGGGFDKHVAAYEELEAAVRNREGADDACLATVSVGALRRLKTLIDDR